MLKRPLLMVVLLPPFLAIPVAAFATYNSQHRFIEGRSSSGPMVGYDRMGALIYRNELSRSANPMSGAPPVTCTRRDKINGYC